MGVAGSSCAPPHPLPRSCHRLSLLFTPSAAWHRGAPQGVLESHALKTEGAWVLGSSLRRDHLTRNTPFRCCCVKPLWFWRLSITETSTTLNNATYTREQIIYFSLHNLLLFQIMRLFISCLPSTGKTWIWTLLYLWHLEQCLVTSTCSINMTPVTQHQCPIFTARGPTGRALCWELHIF